jgi:hypothetical protein
VLPALMFYPSPSAGQVPAIYCLDLLTGELLMTQCHLHTPITCTVSCITYDCRCHRVVAFTYVINTSKALHFHDV